MGPERVEGGQQVQRERICSGTRAGSALIGLINGRETGTGGRGNGTGTGTGDGRNGRGSMEDHAESEGEGVRVGIVAKAHAIGAGERRDG